MIIISLYHEAIYRPLLNVLVYLYHFIPDVGIVIVLLTVLIRLLLAPSFHKSLKSQAAVSSLQPKLDALKEKHKDDQQAQAAAIMGLYKEHGVNPFSSCLPLLLQLPILIALYQVFSKALNNHLDGLYAFVYRPEKINPMFLNILDLSKPNIALGVVAGAAQFWQSKMMLQKNPNQDSAAKAMAFQTTYVFPLLSVWIAASLPAGLPLYWIVTTVFAIVQQHYLLKKNPELVKK